MDEVGLRRDALAEASTPRRRGTPSGPAMRALLAYVQRAADNGVRRLLPRLARASLPLAELRVDAVRETLLALVEADFRVLRGWDPDRAALSTYVARIAQNRARNGIEKAQNRARRWAEIGDEDKLTLLHVPLPGPAARILASQLYDTVRSEVLRQCTPRQAEVWDRYLEQDQSAEEVALALNTTVNAVHTAASEVRKLARQVRDHACQDGDHERE